MNYWQSEFENICIMLVKFEYYHYAGHILRCMFHIYLIYMNLDAILKI